MTRLCRASSRSYPGEICFTRRERSRGSGLRPIPKGVEKPPVPKDNLPALRTETPGGMELLRLIGKYLRAGALIDGQLHATRQGIPQGSPLSPLLANLVLDDFDRELERRGPNAI